MTLDAQLECRVLLHERHNLLQDRLGIGFDRLLGEPVSASEDRPVEVFGASGGAALHRRRMLDEVGGMDESFFFALDDVDLAWRAHMHGWRCMYAPKIPATNRIRPPRKWNALMRPPPNLLLRTVSLQDQTG